MKNMFNKVNAPYLISSALAIATLLASGVFAAAPYVGFLAPVAALSVGLPFIIGGAVFSALVFALSAAVISKNKTISEKDAQLVEQAEEIEGKDRAISEKSKELKERKERNQEEVLDSEALSNLFREEGNQPKINVAEVKDNSYKYTKEPPKSVESSLKSSMPSANSPIPRAKISALLGLATLASTMYINPFDSIHNSLVQSDNSVVNYTSSLPFTCPTDQQAMQSKIDEATKILADANKRYEDSTSHKDAPQNMTGRILSCLRNPFGILVGGAKKNDNNPEPKWYKDLHKSEDREEIIDGGTLYNLFYPKVDNDIHTSRQQSTRVDDIELERLTREVPPSAYSNGLPRVL